MELPAGAFSNTGKDKQPGAFAALKTLWQYRTRANYKSGEYLGPRAGDKVMYAIITLTTKAPETGRDLCQILIFF